MGINYFSRHWVYGSKYDNISSWEGQPPHNTSSLWVLESTWLFLTRSLWDCVAVPSPEWLGTVLIVWVRKPVSELFSSPSRLLPQQCQESRCNAMESRFDLSRNKRMMLWGNQKQPLFLTNKPEESRQPGWVCRPRLASGAKKNQWRV